MTLTDCRRTELQSVRSLAVLEPRWSKGLADRVLANLVDLSQVRCITALARWNSPGFKLLFASNVGELKDVSQ